MDPFDLASKFNMLLVFDCPTSKDSQAYAKFSDGIMGKVGEVAVVFLDTDLPAGFAK